MSDKPPYRVPLMSEIAAMEPNGIKVISTFSGGGGSSTGYRMAGCTVLGASEFVPAAQDVYRLNASPSTIIWPDDIRTMSGLDMLKDVGLDVGELDILDGSPPCAAFSTAGKRSAGWGQVKKYSDTSQRVDDLFYEFARILEQIQPKAFVAENVEGLVKGVAKGYFKAIHKRLTECGYRVSASVLDASRLGVPQRRKRVIFIGIRNDLNRAPQFPEPLPYIYTMRDALPWLDGQVKPGAGDGWEASPGWNDAAREPSATIGASPSTGNGRFPASVVSDLSPFIATVPKWGGPASGEDTIDKPVFTITAGGVSNTTAERFALVYGSDTFSRKRFGTHDMVESTLDRAAPTVMAHGMGGVHMIECGFVTEEGGDVFDAETGEDLRRVATVVKSRYPDRTLRKLAIAEVKRLCSYPDDYQLTGKYAQRWERLGRSVPPVMMKYIAEAVIETLCAD